MTLGGWNIAKIEVKGQRSSKIWQPLKKDIKSHSFVTVSRQKLIFGRMIEVRGGIIAFMNTSLTNLYLIDMQNFGIKMFRKTFPTMYSHFQCH